MDDYDFPNPAKFKTLPQTNDVWQLEHRKLDIPGSKAGRQGKKVHLLLLLDTTNEEPAGLLPLAANPKPDDIRLLFSMAMQEPPAESGRTPHRPRQINFTNPDWLRALSHDLWSLDIATGTARPSNLMDEILPDLEQAIAAMDDEDITPGPDDYIPDEVLGDFHLAADEAAQQAVFEQFGLVPYLRIEQAGKEPLFLILMPKELPDSSLTANGLFVMKAWDELLTYVRQAMEDQEFAVPDGTLAMVFVEKKQMDQDEVRYIKKMRWKLTDPQVFPRLFRMAKNEPDLPSREEFEMTSAILRALVQVTEQLELEPYEPEIAPFSTPVSVHSGNQVFNFEVIFPAGEIPEDMKDSLSDDYEGEEDEDDDIFSIDPFGLGLQEDPLLSTDELKEADQLAGQADEVESEDEAIRLAQQALAASPNHPLPYLVMEQHTDDEEERKRWIREGVQAFDRLLEKADSVTRMKFFAHATDFSTGAAAWDLLYDQAELAVEENDFDTAQAAYERMLELEYEDYEEIRSLLMELYLRAGKNEQARKLLSNYEDHFGVGEYYLRALVQFRVEGNTGPARKNLNIAFKDNRDIADYLTARKPMPLPSFAIETEEEDDEDEMVVDEDDNDMDNINFVQRYFQIAYSTPGFIDWLKKHTK